MLRPALLVTPSVRGILGGEINLKAGKKKKRQSSAKITPLSEEEIKKFYPESDPEPNVKFKGGKREGKGATRLRNQGHRRLRSAFPDGFYR